MQEDFLHHVWLHKKFALESLQTTENQSIIIKSVGLPNVNSGTDFLMHKFILTTNCGLAQWKFICNPRIGMPIIMKKTPYDNVILHVVWEHNSEVFRADNSRVPTLVLQSFVHPQILNNYKEFFSAVHQIIGTPIIRLKNPLQNE